MDLLEELWMKFSAAFHSMSMAGVDSILESVLAYFHVFLNNLSPEMIAVMVFLFFMRNLIFKVVICDALIVIVIELFSIVRVN